VVGGVSSHITREGVTPYGSVRLLPASFEGFLSPENTLFTPRIAISDPPDMSLQEPRSSQTTEAELAVLLFTV
jgi:hypothetical protein